MALGDESCEASRLTAKVGVDKALNGCHWRHADKYLECWECQGASHEAIGYDSLQRGKDDTEEGEDEADDGEVVVAISCQCNTEDEGNDGEVG